MLTSEQLSGDTCGNFQGHTGCPREEAEDRCKASQDAHVPPNQQHPGNPSVVSATQSIQRPTRGQDPDLHRPSWTSGPVGLSGTSTLPVFQGSLGLGDNTPNFPESHQPCHQHERTTSRLLTSPLAMPPTSDDTRGTNRDDNLFNFSGPFSRAP